MVPGEALESLEVVDGARLLKLLEEGGNDGQPLGSDRVVRESNRVFWSEFQLYSLCFSPINSVGAYLIK